MVGPFRTEFNLTEYVESCLVRTHLTVVDTKSMKRSGEDMLSKDILKVWVLLELEHYVVSTIIFFLKRKLYNVRIANKFSFNCTSCQVENC